MMFFGEEGPPFGGPLFFSAAQAPRTTPPNAAKTPSRSSFLAADHTDEKIDRSPFAKASSQLFPHLEVPPI